MISEEGAERRRFPRLACRTAVQYRPVGQPGGFEAGSLSRDVSAGGVRFQTGQFLSHRSRFVMQVALPGMPAPLRTVVQVCWTCKRPHSDTYEIGAQFIEITPQDRGRLADYVERGVQAPLAAPSR